MESLSEMQKLVFIYAGYVAKMHNLPINDEAAAFFATKRSAFINDLSVPVLMQIGKERVRRTNILSATDLFNPVKDVSVERDYVVLLRVNGDVIDVTIITEGSSLSSLPMDSLSMDLIVCVSGLFDPDPLAAQVLAEFLRVLKSGSNIFILLPLKSASDTSDKEPLVRKLVQAISVQAELSRAGFLVLRWGMINTSIATELFRSAEIKARKGSTIEFHDDEDDDYPDEDDLTDLIEKEEVERQGPVYPPVPDPEPGKFQADCTMERCGQGDAFRCRTCPYRGCPWGEPGVNITPNFPPAEN